MQFIDFKKEHFSYDREKKQYLLELFKEGIGYGEIKVLQKQCDTFANIAYEIIHDPERAYILMKSPYDIRVFF
ncbi:hypothetical protein [uncultured Chryseobacterium sp.]|uniref:hypothetical protein n=1 Tax=uncultured Chryseobacterium sp. TaxID=259322 RepID=UPI0025F8965E|nr:hypothetical protein [uncultured Chryseobacterium sp.]